MTPEPGIEVVFFLLVVGVAEGLQIANVILIATGKGDDLVNGKVIFQVSFAATFAVIAIALKNISPHLWGNANLGRLSHEFPC